MPRTIWKGAITFGLVYIPVALRAASRTHDLDFDWLDRRDMAPVGYKRINKTTGEPIDSADIVKGYEYESDRYVLLGDEDFRQANPKATQTIEILGFVDVKEITPEYFVTPYYLEVLGRGEKAYALLRQVLRDSKRAGLASVVIHSKQHLATLLVHGEWLMLNTMRFADEVLAPEDMTVVDESHTPGKAELGMAQRLIDEMTQAWDPERYRDTYRDDLLARIQARVEAGQTHELAAPADEEVQPQGAKVIDLMAALRASLGQKTGKDGPGKTPPAASKPAEKPTRKAARAGKEEKQGEKGREHPRKKPVNADAKPTGKATRTRAAKSAPAGSSTAATATTATTAATNAATGSKRKRA